MYLYKVIYEKQKFAGRLEDNSMPEDVELTCMQLFADDAFVGTADGSILVFDIGNIITYKQKILLSEDSIESIILLPGNLLLASTDTGNIMIVSVLPNVQSLGILTTTNCSNGTIVVPNDDFSLLCVGGGDTRLNIEDM